MNLLIEDQGGHLLVRGRLFLSTLEASQHFRELGEALATMRRAGRNIRVLVDLRACPPQSAEVANMIRERTTHLYGPDDRVAILVASSILKLQLKRIHAEQHFQVFLAEEEGREFLARGSIDAVAQQGRRAATLSPYVASRPRSLTTE